MNTLQATTNLLTKIMGDETLVNKLMKVRRISKSHDEYETAGDAQEIVYNYFNYWTTFKHDMLIESMEDADYLAILHTIELAKLNGEI